MSPSPRRPHKHPQGPLSLIATGLIAGLLATCAHAEAPGEPEIQHYAIDMEAKVLTDRRTNGLSDTYLRPGAEFTMTAAHESGFLAYLQLGSVARANFPESKRYTALTAVGYRWGNPEGWHFGVGAAQEMFPGSKVSAPKNPLVDANDTIDTRFDTTFGLFEFGYGILEGRYLYVLSKDFRGNNTAVVCGSRYGTELNTYATTGEGDPTAGAACYGDSVQHSGGSQLLSLDLKYPLTPQTKLLAHVGYTQVANFSQINTTDYKLGVLHTRWGLDFGLEAVAATMNDRSYAITYDTYGHSKRIDRTALVASVAKRF